MSGAMSYEKRVRGSPVYFVNFHRPTAGAARPVHLSGLWLSAGNLIHLRP